MSNIYDKQTKWMVVLLLVAFGLITAGTMLGYSEIEQLREKVREGQTNETVPQQLAKQDTGESISPDAAPVVGGGELIPVTGQPNHQWPDLGEGHCLLVLVEPPDNEPDDLTNMNTLKIPIRLCNSFLLSMIELEELGYISKEELIFKRDI